MLQSTHDPHHHACALIRNAHRERRFLLKIRQGLDRRLESFVRSNMASWDTDNPAWDPDLPEAQRTKINQKVLELIEKARNGEGNPVLVRSLAVTAKAQEPLTKPFNGITRRMEQLAEELPVADWINNDVPGVGMLGLAIIIGEAGPLDLYSNPDKLKKRLGYAPYDGCAGATWKRESWRPRKLTSEEWKENPFSGERHAMIKTIAVWLRNAQWISVKRAKKLGLGDDWDEGRPNGYYGEEYAKRRAHTLITHPEWTKGHRQNDALRVMMQKFLIDLWAHWNDQVLKP